ncbi:hypothetical protein BM43_1493 [Burkholderia gladioli]|uniref:Uncharacterized protein n=1 Tax=Burkholderia gladioli TaxID=28095 RepID=A0AAW3F771_BURGA|nr:hypothetical protein BM43_1493 [Burkholderia gladioli]KGC17083.1 hypothetical protein DM48_4149 [Burkholderia gladioli]SQA89326.1 Uncharacterised protein [Burkholderia gladioli]
MADLRDAIPRRDAPRHGGHEKTGRPARRDNVPTGRSGPASQPGRSSRRGREAYLPPMLLSGFHSPFSTLYIVMPPFFRSPRES